MEEKDKGQEQSSDKKRRGYPLTDAHVQRFREALDNGTFNVSQYEFQLLEQTAKLGHCEAQLLLGILYDDEEEEGTVDGKKVAKNEKNAFYYYDRAFREKSLIYHNSDLGKHYEKLAQYDNAARWYKQVVAESGEKNAEALNCLAILYREGRGIAAKDETKAKEYYEKAAELGQLHACYNLAMMLRQSLENSDDQQTDADNNNSNNNNNNNSNQSEERQETEKKMFKLYKSAADEPNLYMKDAQYNVGICFREGTGVTKDVHQAVKYLQFAANQKDVEAQHALGSIFLEELQDKQIVKSAAERKQNHTFGMHWMREAAKQDYPPALYNLGALTEHETQSLQYYKKSAELGYAPAQRYLALCHLNAQGGVKQKDEKTAVEWLQKAAAQQDAEAVYHLALCHEQGLGGLQADEQKAQELFELAQNLGYEEEEEEDEEEEDEDEEEEEEKKASNSQSEN